MKLCRGCKYLVVVDGEPSRCKQGEEWPTVLVHDPYDGREHLKWVRTGPAAEYAEAHLSLRPTLDVMRAPGGRCGPEARLYRPTLLWRWWARWMKCAGVRWNDGGA